MAIPMGIPMGILWVWDGYGNWNAIPTAALVSRGCIWCGWVSSHVFFSSFKIAIWFSMYHNEMTFVATGRVFWALIMWSSMRTGATKLQDTIGQTLYHVNSVSHNLSILLHIFRTVYKWKNFEHRSIFGEFVTNVETEWYGRLFKTYNVHAVNLIHRLLSVQNAWAPFVFIQILRYRPTITSPMRLSASAWGNLLENCRLHLSVLFNISSLRYLPSYIVYFTRVCILFRLNRPLIPSFHTNHEQEFPV